MNYKVLVCDIDDTLLNDQKELSKENKDAILKIIEKGIKVVLCSGRGTVDADRFLAELNLKQSGDYAITYNGAAIIDIYNNNPIFQKTIEKEYVRRLFEIAKIYKTNIQVFIGDYIFTNEITENLLLKRSDTKAKIVQIEDFKDIENKDILKIVLFDDNEKLKEIKEKIEVELKEKLNFFFSKPFYLEFTNVEADKGSTMARLLEILGISKKEVIAVGDSYNDMNMLINAGLGVAVANSCQPLKDIAKYVTSSTNNQSAIKEVIGKFLV